MPNPRIRINDGQFLIDASSRRAALEFGDEFEVDHDDDGIRVSLPNTFTFVDGAHDDGELQAAIDALPPFGELLVNTAGTYYLSEPQRLTTQVGLKGLGDSTVFVKDAFWFGGPTILTGPIQGPHPHGDAILDDADFSYVFTNTLPRSWMPLGGEANGCYPRDFEELNLRLWMVVNGVGPSGGTFFTISGPAEVFGVDDFILDVSWNIDLQHLTVTFWTDASGVQLTTTTDFTADFGTRHLVEMDWDGTTLKLLVDGVVEASAAIGGTFSNDGSHPVNGTYVNKVANIGGRSQHFGQVCEHSCEFDLGGFFLGNQSKHQTNYTPTWLIPSGADLDGVFCMVQCTNDRENGDLIKLVAASNGGYSWMQTRQIPEFTSQGNDVSFEAFRFGTAGSVGGCSVEVFHTTRARVKRITSTETALVCSGTNIHYGEYGSISSTGGLRYSSLISGGIVDISGVNKFSGSDIGLVLLQGDCSATSIHIYDYFTVGAWLESWGGNIDILRISDESTPFPEFAPQFAVVFRAVDGNASFLTMNLDVNVINSPIVPFQVVNNRHCVLTVNGSSPIMPAATAAFFEFRNPTVSDPIYSNMKFVQDIPIADRPEKVLTPTGPVGRVTLADASVTVTAYQAREWDLAGVTLTANRTVTLDDDAGSPVSDGTVVEVVANCTFGGFTLTIDNHDGTDLHVFSAAGSRRFRFSRTTGNWSRIEAA